MFKNNYLKYQEKIRPGDIIFTFKKGNILSKLIWIVSRKKPSDPKISHSIIYLGKRLIVESTLFNGVKIRKIKNYKQSEYDVKVKGTEQLTEEKQEELFNYAVDKANNIGYSYGQLFYDIIKKIFGLDKIGDFSKSQMVCSEFVVECYRHIGINIGEGIISAEISPIEIYQSKLLTKTLF